MLGFNRGVPPTVNECKDPIKIAEQSEMAVCISLGTAGKTVGDLLTFSSMSYLTCKSMTQYSRGKTGHDI